MRDAMGVICALAIGTGCVGTVDDTSGTQSEVLVVIEASEDGIMTATLHDLADAWLAALTLDTTTGAGHFETRFESSTIGFDFTPDEAELREAALTLWSDAQVATEVGAASSALRAAECRYLAGCVRNCECSGRISRCCW